jgi:hypothetical protein
MVATIGAQSTFSQRIRMLLLAALLSLSLFAVVPGSTRAEAAPLVVQGGPPLPGEHVVCTLRNGVIVCYWK